MTSVDQEGTKKGFDLELLLAVRERVSIPIIGSGGAGNAAQVAEAIRQTDIDAAACASLFHYQVVDVAGLKTLLTQDGISVRV